MAKKGGQVVLQEEIDNDEDWAKMLEKPGLYVVDVYTKICGPCIPMIGNLKRVKMDLGVDTLHYAIAMSDNITALERFRGKSEPNWIFFFDGKMVNLITGVDAPRLINLIVYEVEQYSAFKKGKIRRQFLPLNKITDEERKNMIKIEEYQRQKMKMEKKIKDKKLMKLRKRALETFLPNVLLKTCVVFFPHTVKYIMVEKPRNEDEDENESGPVMVEKRVCKVANECRLKYEDLTVVEANELQLTEDTLDEMFFLDQQILNSFPDTLIEELLTKKIYSVMLSLSEIKTDSDEALTDDPLTKPRDITGLIEEKTSTIIYGNSDPLNPTPDSIAYRNMVINEFGEKVPSLYTPVNSMSKVSALTVLFKKFCANNGFVVPEPHLPQYLIKFEIIKSSVVLPVIKDLKDKVIQYGFFRDTDSPKLLCKNFEMLTTYGLENIEKDVILVLSVLWDEKDKTLLRFAGLRPIYMSSNSETGIADADKYFPYDFDQMDGELNMWLESDMSGVELIEEEINNNYAAVEEENRSDSSEQNSYAASTI